MNKTEMLIDRIRMMSMQSMSVWDSHTLAKIADTMENMQNQINAQQDIIAKKSTLISQQAAKMQEMDCAIKQMDSYAEKLEEKLQYERREGAIWKSTAHDIRKMLDAAIAGQETLQKALHEAKSELPAVPAEPITYCINNMCPFQSCLYHLSHAPKGTTPKTASRHDDCKSYASFMGGEVLT